MGTSRSQPPDQIQGPELDRAYTKAVREDRHRIKIRRTVFNELRTTYNPTIEDLRLTTPRANRYATL
jgi:hypothetical protein